MSHLFRPPSCCCCYTEEEDAARGGQERRDGWWARFLCVGWTGETNGWRGRRRGWYVWVLSRPYEHGDGTELPHNLRGGLSKKTKGRPDCHHPHHAQHHAEPRRPGWGGGVEGGGGVGAAGAWPWRTTRVACASSRLVNGHSSHMPPPRALGIPPPDPRPCRRRAPPVGVGEGGVVRCGWVSTQWRGTLPNKTGFRFSSSPRPCFCSELFSKAGPSCAPHPGVVHPPTPLVGFCGTSTDLDTNTMSLHTGW